MTASQAMARCLREIVIRDHVAITLFRSFANGNAPFHGLMNWVLHKRQKSLVLTPSLANIAVFNTIVWNGEGTQETNQLCNMKLSQFIALHGGPHSEPQWFSEGVDEMHGEIWGALNSQFGYPVFES